MAGSKLVSLIFAMAALKSPSAIFAINAGISI